MTIAACLLALAAASIASAAHPAAPDTPRRAPTTGVWAIEREWSPEWEDDYSAWVEALFARAPADATRGWRPLDQAFRDPSRNLLYGALGLGEDDPKSKIRVRARADCGDVPYMLRAYFAWKRGLPLRYSRCTRGNGLVGPRCGPAEDNLTDAFDAIRDPVARFNAFLGGRLAGAVHSGTLRTLPEDDGSDFYPLPLARRFIRPGDVFVDVGSHVLVVVQWNEEGLFAVDGHPDGSLSRKRFSPRAFPYYPGTRTGGFKAFRPLVMRAGHPLPQPNSAMGAAFSLSQYGLSSAGDYYRALSLTTAF